MILALVVASAAGCAHAPPRAPPAEVFWPAPPDAPRVRLAAEYPDPDAPPPKRSWWRVALDAVAGVSDEDRRREGQLARPFGVAVLGADVVVADPDAPGVVRYRADRTVAQVGCRELEWAAPMAVAAAPDGALWVADGAAGVIVRVAPDGGCRALGAGILERPTGLALDGDRLLVTDPPRHQVVALSLDGRELGRWGSLGEGDGELHFPSAIARARDGSFLVVDALNFRVARFGPDGAWRGAFGFAGDGGGAFSRPKGIAVDEAGRLYVTDAQRDAVLVFDADGSFDVALGATGTERGRLALPAGVAVTGGRIFVADSHNHRVQVFEILGGRP
jgi:DNA-binding beta-propeller fold protein YncE